MFLLHLQVTEAFLGVAPGDAVEQHAIYRLHKRCQTARDHRAACADQASRDEALQASREATIQGS